VRILLLLVVTIGCRTSFLDNDTTDAGCTGDGSAQKSPTGYSHCPTSRPAGAARFPVLFEPWLTLPQLGWTWSLLYSYSAHLRSDRVALTACAHAGEARDSARGSIGGPVLTLSLQLRWLALAAWFGDAARLTNHVTQNVASVPFLW